MLGTYSYHEIIKKTVVGFGTLFNNIELRNNFACLVLKTNVTCW